MTDTIWSAKPRIYILAFIGKNLLILTPEDLKVRFHVLIIGRDVPYGLRLPGQRKQQ